MCHSTYLNLKLPHIKSKAAPIFNIMVQLSKVFKISLFPIRKDLSLKIKADFCYEYGSCNDQYSIEEPICWTSDFLLWWPWMTVIPLSCHQYWPSSTDAGSGSSCCVVPGSSVIRTLTFHFTPTLLTYGSYNMSSVKLMVWATIARYPQVTRPQSMWPHS